MVGPLDILIALKDSPIAAESVARAMMVPVPPCPKCKGTVRDKSNPARCHSCGFTIIPLEKEPSYD
jgi:transposase-like protein